MSKKKTERETKYRSLDSNSKEIRTQEAIRTLCDPQSKPPPLRYKKPSISGLIYEETRCSVSGIRRSSEIQDMIQ